MAEGNLLAMMSAGVCGFVQAGSDNTRPRPAGVPVDAADDAVVRWRETYEDLVTGEETS